MGSQVYDLIYKHNIFYQEAMTEQLWFGNLIHFNRSTFLEVTLMPSMMCVGDNNLFFQHQMTKRFESGI